MAAGCCESLAVAIRTNPLCIQQHFTNSIEWIEQKMIHPRSSNTTITPLAFACLDGSFESVQLILSQPAVDLDAMTDDRTALSYASERGSAQIVELLIRSGAMLRESDLFSLLSRSDNFDERLQCAFLMFPHIRVFNMSMSQRAELLCHTIKGGHQQALEFLIRQEFPVDGFGGWIPLLFAIQGDASECLEVLLQSGAIFSPAWLMELDGHHATPLMFACAKCSVPCVAKLLPFCDAQQAIGEHTALWYACERGNADIVELLLRSGVTPNWNSLRVVSSKCGSSAERTRCAQLMLSRGIPVTESQQSEILCFACKYSQSDIVTLLLEHKFPINGFGEHVPLHSAVQTMETSSMRRLIEHGVDLRSRGRLNRTALMECRSAQAAQLLLESGFEDAHAVDDDGRTALHHSVFRQSVELTQLIADIGVDINLRDSQELTAHDLAVRCKSSRVAEFLRSRGATSSQCSLM